MLLASFQQQHILKLWDSDAADAKKDIKQWTSTFS